MERSRPKRWTVCTRCPTVPELLEHSAGAQWDNESGTPWFQYEFDNVSKTPHQVWYENARSLELKARYAKSAGVRGVGMWAANMLNYTRAREAAAIWAALAVFRG